MKYILISFLVVCSSLSFAQNGFNITPTYRKAITQSEMQKAVFITDINPGFPSSWIKEYVSVELVSEFNGTTVIAEGSSINFTTEQMDLLSNTKVGSDLSFRVQYYADTDEVNNRELKHIAFSYGVAPESMAIYNGGMEVLDQYLVDRGLNEIAKTLDGQEKTYQAMFTIDKTGTVINARMNDSTGLPDVDQAILNAIKEMEKWEPALDDKGESIAQDFVLNIGMVGC